MAFNKEMTAQSVSQKKNKSAIREWFDSVLFAVIAATLIRWLFFEAFTIPTPSMENSLLVGDFLFVSKLHYGTRTPKTPLQVPLTHQTIWGTNIPSYTDAIQLPQYRLPGFSEVKRGDVVVFNYPPELQQPVDLKTNYIKRCVGLPGDKLEVRDLQVFTNGIAICIATALLIYIGYREYALREAGSNIAALQTAIAANKPLSDQSIALFKNFQEQERKLQALNEFLAPSKLVVSDLILEIGATLPESVILSSIDYKPTGVTLRGKIEGASDEASGRAVAYIEELRKHPGFLKLFDDIGLTSIVRDQGSGRMSIQVDLKFKVPAKPAAKKK